MPRRSCYLVVPCQAMPTSPQGRPSFDVMDARMLRANANSEAEIHYSTARFNRLLYAEPSRTVQCLGVRTVIEHHVAMTVMS